MKTFVVSLAVLLFLGTGNAFASDAVETSGDAVAVAVPAAALVIALTRQDKDGALQFAESYAAATAVTYGLKYTINERRPDGGKHSFPSFHASSSFAAASFIQNRYGWLYGIPAYVASSYVGWTRIETREHWAKDVLGGAAIGIASGFIFTKPYDGARISPVVGNGYWGLEVSKAF